jgi:phosphopentomutase
MRRAIIIVLDSVGIGEMPDAAEYGDVGSNTLGNLARACGGLSLPTLQSFGLGNIRPIPGVPPVESPRADYGIMEEMSAGKDTTTGHWEIAGILTRRAFPVYPDGFPPDIIVPFEEAIGRKVIGNKASSGTDIIKELGEIHVKTGSPIVYTSADSVFQIAAHEEVIPLEELYRICRIARSQLRGEHNIARVIARPFVGAPGSFTRTENREDFSLEPHLPTILDAAVAQGKSVFGIGKIIDIFAGRGISESNHTGNNSAGTRETIRAIRESEYDIIFTNLVDFDMLWGHRNDTEGYRKGLEDFDSHLPEIAGAMKEGDLLFLTADHGCDPTTPSTDHSREYVPLLVYGPSFKSGVDLGMRKTFADIAATIADHLSIEYETPGTSFLPEISRNGPLSN